MSIIKYGTSGFREHYTKILEICEIFPSILDMLANKMNKIGLMITASHNPIFDNGIKIIDNNGEMLSPIYDSIITDIINNGYDKSIYENKNITIYIGYDTRPHSLLIRDKLITLCHYWTIVDLGIITTPMCHVLVDNPTFNYVLYYEQLFKTYKINKIVKPRILVDCANGVGSIIMKQFKQKLENIIDIKLINCDNFDKVNDKCGADYIYKNGFKIDENYDLIASLDGDADRLVLLQKNQCINGDKLGAFFINYIANLLKKYNLDYDIHFIYTAYTNKRCIEYVLNCGAQIVECQTGVKYLHHEAKKYDISVYFEPNGHGTILFSKRFIDYSKSIPEFNKLIQFTNRYIGDGISLLLTIIQMGNFKNFNNMYIDNEYKEYSLKYIEYPINNIIFNNCHVANLETKFNCKIFVRPSGTEKLIRIYIEKLGKSNLSIDEIYLELIRK